MRYLSLISVLFLCSCAAIADKATQACLAGGDQVCSAGVVYQCSGTPAQLSTCSCGCADNGKDCIGEKKCPVTLTTNTTNPNTNIVGDCTPACDGKTCGDDGCGGSCGSCVSWQACVSANCVAGFTPTGDYCTFHQCTPIAPTRQTKCYDDGTLGEIPCPDIAGSDSCGDTPFCGQDAQYPYAGSAQVFTCYNTDGTVQDPCATTASVDEVVTDSLTGLTWQRTFETNKTWQQAVDYCENLIYASRGDWRLPNWGELQSIVDYRNYSPAIDTTAFPSTNYGFWTTAALPYAVGAANSIDFKSGGLTANSTTTAMGVRCVRKYQVFTNTGNYTNRFLVNGENDVVITDTLLGLMWQKNYLVGKSWQQTLAYCENSTYNGFSDWRVPTISELVTLINTNTRDPSSDLQTIFIGSFYSSTTITTITNNAWRAMFGGGETIYGGKNGPNYVTNCVRTAQ